MQTRSCVVADRLAVVIVVAAALLLYGQVFGWRTLDPTYTAWLLKDEPAQHYLGWYFFRTEAWAWPPASMQNFGLTASSVAMTDAIPLLAIPFKLLSPLLPENFQYFGGWMLACFILNGYFGLRLMTRLSVERSLRVLGALFFVLSPPLLFRAHGHESLMAHWLLLAAFERYFSGWSGRGWLFLAAIAALCHPYLLFMLLGLMSAALLDNARAFPEAGSSTRYRANLQFLAILLTLALLMWLAGYFVDGASDRSGYQYFSMNLLALFDPQFFNASRFLVQHDFSPDFAPYGQYEGFQYLGIGMMLLMALAAGAYSVSPSGQLRAWLRRYWPLALAVFVLWLLALSNKVMLGKWHLFTLPLPASLEHGLSLFRASGRFGWPLFYLLNLLALALTVRTLAPRRAQIILVCALALQVLDQTPKYAEFRQLFQQRAAAPNTLPSQRWSELARHAQRLVLLPPHPAMEEIYIPFAHFAARHRLATNASRLARAEAGSAERQGQFAAQQLAQGQRDPATLYIFHDPAATATLPPATQAEIIELDGYAVLPPLATSANHAR